MAISIVDYINSTGGDSSYAARKKLAEQQGIAGYRGTAEQNLQMLRNLQNAQKPGVTGSATGASSNSGPSANVLAGQNQTAGSQGQPQTNAAGTSAAGASSGSTTYPVRGYQRSETTQKAYNRMASYDANMPGDYEESDYVKDRRDQLTDVENNRPDAFKSRWDSQITSLLDSIYNQQPFNYDASQDNLYKQYAQQYQNNASRAMRDTIGNASALSGGYGSSYAQNVGQQAYDQTMSGLNDKMLDFYDRAYQKYLDTRNNRYNQLNAFQTQDNTDYARYRDTVSDWQTDRNYYLNALQGEQTNDLNVYNDNAQNYWNGANYLAGRYDTELNNDFAAYQQDKSEEQWQKEYEMNKTAQDLDNQLKQLQIQQAQMALQQAAAGGSGSGGSGGGRRSGGRSRSKSSSSKSSKKKSSTSNLIPTVKASDLLAQYAYLKKENGGSALASIDPKQYVQEVAKNNFIDFKPSMTPIKDDATKKFRDMQAAISVQKAWKKLAGKE